MFNKIILQRGLLAQIEENQKKITLLRKAPLTEKNLRAIQTIKKKILNLTNEIRQLQFRVYNIPVRK